VPGPALPDEAPTAFEKAGVHFEQNATDGDVEVVFEATGSDDGLAKLGVTSPDGRTVLDFSAPDPTTMGLRSFAFESPEPKDVAGLKAAYPEGVYRFAGETAAGQRFRSESTLRHALPATASFLSPGIDAEDVAVDGLEIRWSPVAGVSGYVVEIEQDELDVKLKTRLPRAASSFSVPDGFLRPGTEYTLAIGTFTANGNLSVVETTFTTARIE
jgi:hypothetical protein